MENVAGWIGAILLTGLLTAAGLFVLLLFIVAIFGKGD